LAVNINLEIYKENKFAQFVNVVSKGILCIYNKQKSHLRLQKKRRQIRYIAFEMSFNIFYRATTIFP